MGSVCSTVDVKQTGSEVAGAEPNSSVYVTAYSTDNIVLGKSDPVAYRKNQATPQDYAGSPPEKDMKAGDGSNPVATTKSEETRPLPEYSLIQGDISKPRLNSSIEENPGRVSTSGSGGDNKNNDNNESSGNKTEAVNATNNVVASDLVSNEAKETLPMDVDAAPEERRDPVGISDVAMTQDADNDSGLDGEDMDDHDVDGDALEFLDASLGHLDAPAKMASIGELAITKPAPDFECNAVVNGSFETVKLSSYRGKYVVLFFYPLDFTFVCPTEIIAFSDRAEEFRAANCEILACSTDSVYSHLAWIDTPRKQGGLGPMKIPLLADRTQEVSKKYGCLKPDEGVAFRGLYIIDDKGNLRQITINDLPVGRSVDETLRLVQAFQFTDKYGEVCPAGWKPGKETMKPDPKESQQFFNKVN